MLSVEHERTDIALYLLETYPLLDLENREAKEGNSALHLACLKGNLAVAEKIFNDRPKLCLKQNYVG